MPISTKTRPRGKHLPPDSDDAAMSLRSAFQNDQLLEDFGPELTDLTSVIGHHDENQPADVAKLQSLLWAAGHTDLKDIEGPTGIYSERHLEEPLKKFQQERDLKVDARVKPGGPTIRALGAAVRGRQDGPAPTIVTSEFPTNARLKRISDSGTKIAQTGEKAKPLPDVISPIPNPKLRNDDSGHGKFGAGRGARKHEGIDIEAPPGTPIQSAVDGTVERIGEPYRPGHRLHGKFTIIWVRGNDGRLYGYFYTAPRNRDGNPTVNPGDSVKKGQVIGTLQNRAAGEAGMTNHLHLEFREGPGRGKPIDPTPWIFRE